VYILLIKRTPATNSGRDDVIFNVKCLILNYKFLPMASLLGE
jgi:hypothetical protein